MEASHFPRPIQPDPISHISLSSLFQGESNVGMDCYLPAQRLITVSIDSPLTVMDSLERLTNNLIQACENSLSLFNTTTIYSKLMFGVLSDLRAHSDHIHSSALFLCQLAPHKPNLQNKTINNIGRNTTNVKNPPDHNILDRLTQSWTAHAAIGLGIQTFGRITSTKSISNHLGKAIVNLANEVKSSQDIIAHFLVFQNAAASLHRHTNKILSYFQTIASNNPNSKLSNAFSQKIKFHLLSTFDLKVNPFRATRILNRILDKSHFSAKYTSNHTSACNNHIPQLACDCTTLQVIVHIKMPKSIVNCLDLNPLSGRLFNPLHKNSETYLFTPVSSIILTKNLNIQATLSFSDSLSYTKIIFLTQPIYRLPLSMRAFIIPDVGLYLADPMLGRKITYNCTFMNELGVLSHNNTIINAEKQGTVYYFPNCQITSNGILNIYSESLLLSKNLISNNPTSPNNTNDIFLNIKDLSQEVLYKNSSVTMNDDTIRSIENELTLSQDSEQTLNRRLSKLEDGNYIRNLIKHYSDIFFITLILACLIAITLFITNCIFRTRFARKESSDKHKIKSHIHRLENYVLGIERADFKGDLIKTKPTENINNKTPAPTNNTPPLTPAC